MRYLAVCIVCVAVGASLGAARAQDVTISGGWVHAVPPFQTVAPGYLSLRSDKDDELTGVTIDTGGTATLVKAPGAGIDGETDAHLLKLPADKTVTLGPGGTYLALVGRDAPLIPGSRVGMTLYFKHAAPESVVLNVLSQ
jgi:copper(I)-binding protein